MNNPLSYCGLLYVRVNASDKDLPVPLHDVDFWHEIIRGGSPKVAANGNSNFFRFRWFATKLSKVCFSSSRPGVISVIEIAGSCFN